MKSIIAAIGLFAACGASAEIKEQVVTYKDGSTVLEGVLIFNSDGPKSSPGVLVVHDWLGLTEKTKQKGRDLAQLGYVVFAADIYGQGVRPSDASTAGAEAGKYKKDRKLFRKRLTLALEQLAKSSGVDNKRLAAVGYCFGGTGVIELARAGAKLKGVVSFHGGLDSPQPELGAKIKTSILALHGANDPFVSSEDLAAFETEMKTNKIDWQLVKFGGAVHSFTDKTAGTDPKKGAAYNESADKRSWQMMKDFFTERL